MKSISWLALTRLGSVRVFFSLALILFVSAGCSDDSVDLSGPGADASAKKGIADAKAANRKSQSKAGDYVINTDVVGKVWTYTISKIEGAKDLSHFIIDLNNCENNQTLSIESIVSATVNGKPAVLSSSEGNTGCILTTDNFVKFDDFEDADVYIIVFELDKVYGNFLSTTGWLKAGTSCHAYVIEGPCCS